MPGYFTLTKHPDEEYAVGLEFEAPDLESGETIQSGVVTITPSGESGDLVTKGSLAIGTDTIKQVVEKGRSGIRYTVKFTVTTSVPHIYVEKIFVNVED
jgi:hypothetical protein